MRDEEYGWAKQDGCPGLTEAVRLLEQAKRRPPDEGDRPTSTFPMTPAARAARQYDREQKK